MSFRRIGQWGMVGALAFGACAYLSYALDRMQLRESALCVVGARNNSTQKTLSLMHWVHAIPQTAENRRHFLLPRLRATPMQVLESGGDCADKSRLLSAMLREVGVQSTMVMLFDPRTQRATHTVVCAFLEDGSTMVVDPAYGLSFPVGESGRYLGLSDLRSDPLLLDKRLRELRQARGRRDPIQVYDPAAAGYSLASSINWNRNPLTRWVYELLLPTWGEDIYSMPRPRFLEEPKLLIALVSSLLFAAVLILHGVAVQVRYMTRTWSAIARERRLPDMSHWTAVKT